jgi:hypothetical protein
VWRIRASIVTRRPAERDVVDIINLAMFCDRLHCLPSQGSLMEQDALTMLLLRNVFQALDERTMRETEAKKRAAKHT